MLPFHCSKAPSKALAKFFTFFARSFACESLAEAKCLHQQILMRGLLLSDNSRSEPATGVVSAYLACDSPSDAIAALERLSPSSIFGWNSLIRYHVRHASLHSALSVFHRMVRIGTRPDHYTFPFVLKACGELPSFRCGVAVHAFVCSNGFESNVFVCNALVSMYSRCSSVEDARQMFDEIIHEGIDDVVSWNSIAAAYASAEEHRLALELFVGMLKRDGGRLTPDPVSLASILPACASLGASVPGRQVHGYAVRHGLHMDLFVGNAIVDMYAKCGRMEEARRAFEYMESKDVVSCNAMVTGYAQNGNFEDALQLFVKMREENIALNVVTWSAVIAGYAQRGLGLEALNVFREMQMTSSEPNAVTIVSLLSACAAVGALLHGKEVHGHILRCLFNQDDNDNGDDLMVKNGLIDMYCKCRSPSASRAIFNSVPLAERNVVTWTTMIGGLAQYGDANDSLVFFSQMLHDGDPKPNAFTISCALMACARLSSLRFGKQIHAYVVRNRYEAAMLFIANCLIDMYSKCADIDAAQAVFDRMTNRNSISWTTLMTGYGLHGRGKDALQVFDGMCKAGLIPDGITFLVVLYACSHSGMVDRGIGYFNKMGDEYGVQAGPEHYACMVDLLGRAGRLSEVQELIKAMPMKPSAVVWVALLSACRIHSNVDLGEYAVKQLMELDSGSKESCMLDGCYTLLSNIYANAGRWADVARIRSLMKKTGIRKRPGCSWVQGNRNTATFFVGDRSHPMSHEIYELIATLMQRIKGIGYVPEMSFALHDVDDEEKGYVLSEHSEKLALAFGILTTAPGAPIRITKNLRICGDCHSAITFISKIVDHEIILRDSSRFHHFKNGSCSCGGYW